MPPLKSHHASLATVKDVVTVYQVQFF
jgi:hypothetical protein